MHTTQIVSAYEKKRKKKPEFMSLYPKQVPFNIILGETGLGSLMQQAA
jgi:hypothetical protein